MPTSPAHFLLLADSGSTKTDWLLLTPHCANVSAHTAGLNPFTLKPEALRATLQTELLPRLPQLAPAGPDIEVWFYGAGCRGSGLADMESALRSVFPRARLHVSSDLLGAARALCHDEPGIACILGTGSNSCLFDGNEIRDNIPPLGFILGDEGSGAVLGRRLAADVLKRQLPAPICELFLAEYSLTADDLLRRVYREPGANRYLAAFAPFLGRHRDEPALRNLVMDEFSRFFRRNVDPYRHPELPVHFVGSIAFFLRAELQAVAAEAGYRVGRILRSPIEGLREYHAPA